MNSVLTNHPGLKKGSLSSNIFSLHKNFILSEFPGLTHNRLDPDLFVKSGIHCNMITSSVESMRLVKPHEVKLDLALEEESVEKRIQKVYRNQEFVGSTVTVSPPTTTATTTTATAMTPEDTTLTSTEVTSTMTPPHPTMPVEESRTVLRRKQVVLRKRPRFNGNKNNNNIDLR